MSCTWPHYDVMMSQTLAWSCHSVRPGASLAHSAISVYSYSWMVRLKYASVHCAGCSAYIGLHRSVYQATSSIPILLYVVICCACGYFHFCIAWAYRQTAMPKSYESTDVPAQIRQHLAQHRVQQQLFQLDEFSAPINDSDVGQCNDDGGERLNYGARRLMYRMLRPAGLVISPQPPTPSSLTRGASRPLPRGHRSQSISLSPLRLLIFVLLALGLWDGHNLRDSFVLHEYAAPWAPKVLLVHLAWCICGEEVAVFENLEGALIRARRRIRWTCHAFIVWALRLLRRRRRPLLSWVTTSHPLTQILLRSVFRSSSFCLAIC